MKLIKVGGEKYPLNKDMTTILCCDSILVGQIRSMVEKRYGDNFSLVYLEKNKSIQELVDKSILEELIQMDLSFLSLGDIVKIEILHESWGDELILWNMTGNYYANKFEWYELVLLRFLLLKCHRIKKKLNTPVILIFPLSGILQYYHKIILNLFRKDQIIIIDRFETDMITPDYIYIRNKLLKIEKWNTAVALE